MVYNPQELQGINRGLTRVNLLRVIKKCFIILMIAFSPIMHFMYVQICYGILYGIGAKQLSISLECPEEEVLKYYTSVVIVVIYAYNMPKLFLIIYYYDIINFR